MARGYPYFVSGTLDSLSDFISFGVAPALILFFWSTQNIHGIGWASVLFFSTCMALRLARFNTQLEDPDPPAFASRFFSGVPAPAAAGLACFPVIISFEIEVTVINQPYLISAWLVFVGLLMVSIKQNTLSVQTALMDLLGNFLWIEFQESIFLLQQGIILE